MAKAVADRLLWAVETLEAAPDDHLLEIGCGHGIAISLICEQLVSGSISAIDRSDIMIDTARRKNQAHVDSGKVILQTGSLDEVDFGQSRFNKIFAVNVNLFHEQPAKELNLIKNLLLPEGRLYLFHQPPLVAKTQAFADEMTAILQQHQFSIDRVIFKELKPMQAVCIISVPLP